MQTRHVHQQQYSVQARSLNINGGRIPISIGTSSIRTGDSILLEQLQANDDDNSSEYQIAIYIPKPTTHHVQADGLATGQVGSAAASPATAISSSFNGNTTHSTATSIADNQLHDNYNCNNDIDDHNYDVDDDKFENSTPEILKVERGLSLSSIEALQVAMIIFIWFALTQFGGGYFLTLRNFTWFIEHNSNSFCKCMEQGAPTKPTWIIGYFTSYHSKNLLIIALMLVGSTLAAVKQCKKYFSYHDQNAKFQFLVELLHIRYARIGLLNYEYMISLGVYWAGGTVFDIVSGFELSAVGDPDDAVVTQSTIGIIATPNVFTICSIVAMLIIQFDLLANPLMYKLYRFCGKLIIVLILIGGIGLIIFQVFHPNFVNGVMWIVFYIMCYDLWYIAADIQNCDGINLTSTRIYVLGFNFAIASIVLLLAYVYYAILHYNVFRWVLATRNVD